MGSFFLTLAQSVFKLCHKLADMAHNASLNAMDAVQAKQFKLNDEINRLEFEYDTHSNLAAKAHDFKTKIAGLLNG